MEDISQIFRNTQNTVWAVKLSSLSPYYAKPQYSIIIIWSYTNYKVDVVQDQTFKAFL